MKNMKADFVFFIYVFGTMSLPWEVTTSVTINSTGGLGDTGTVRCGSEVTFMCNISTYMYSMTWSIDSVIVAQCTLLECTDTELKNTMFTFNTSTGIFTMTINPVTFATNGRVITCEDGTSSTDVTINVIVLQEQSDTTMFDSSYQDTINITVETGCVFPSASVSFHWYYYETGKTPVLYEDGSPVEIEEASECITGRCGGNEVAKTSSTLSLPVLQDGKDYLFQVLIKHKNVPNNEHDIIIISTRTYKFKIPTASEAKSSNKPNIGLIVGLTVGCVVLFVLVVVVVFVIKRRLS